MSEVLQENPVPPLNDQPQESDGGFSKDDLHMIMLTVDGIGKTLEYNAIPLRISATAMMIVSASILAMSAQSDDDLMVSFKQQLDAARARRGNMSLSVALKEAEAAHDGK